jgi:glycine/D-amino acid oxidase-like deaminating enzyme
VLDPASPVALARVVPFWRRVWERGSDPWVLQAGQYTMTPDRHPLIGEAGEGLYVNTGYCGHGVMCSAAGARHLADSLTGRTEEDPYRPDRRFKPRPHLDPL